MENDIKAKLSSLSDMELYKLINAVCVASGMDAKRASAMTSDIPRLRRMLLALSDSQISTLVSSLGKDDIKDVIGRLGEP